MAETRFHVLRWEGDGYSEDPLYTERALFVRHEVGEQVTRQMVMDQFEADVRDGRYVAAKYRIYPSRDTVDLTVEFRVVDPLAP